jgi:hypothetical protein
MRGHQPSRARKTDRSRNITAKVLYLRHCYYMSVFDFSQCSFVLRSLTHDLDDDQSACDEYCASNADSDSKV